MFICTNCENISAKWQGKCNNCQSWNSFVEKKSESKKKDRQINFEKPKKSCEISSFEQTRILSKIQEWDNVVGGGIFPASFMIISGDPGVGKSTLMMQIAHKCSENNKVIYFSTEESLPQIKLRMNRLGLHDSNVLFSDTTKLEEIIAIIEAEKASLVIIDSLQNCRLSNEAEQNFSTTSALKEMAHQLMDAAKKNNCAILMTGHITKEGIIAGPKLLEHLVDAVFYLQNDEEGHRKILSAIKNRFGCIDEVGFFELTESGLAEIKNFNETILSGQNKNSLGCAHSLSFAGSRCLLTEFQALTVPNYGNGIPARLVTGPDLKKVLILAALLEKYLKLDISKMDLFFQTRGNIKKSDLSNDLAILSAISSSLMKKPIPPHTIFAGEVSLDGRIRPPVFGLDKIVKSAQKIGIKNIVLGSAGSKEEEKQKFGSDVTRISHIYELSKIFEL